MRTQIWELTADMEKDFRTWLDPVGAWLLAVESQASPVGQVRNQLIGHNFALMGEAFWFCTFRY